MSNRETVNLEQFLGLRRFRGGGKEQAVDIEQPDAPEPPVPPTAPEPEEETEAEGENKGE